MKGHIDARSTRQESMFPESPAAVSRRIRDLLAGRHVGATRDSALLDQVLLCLFAKIQLLKEDLQGPLLQRVRPRYQSAIRQLRMTLGSECLPDSDLKLDASSLEFVDQELSRLKMDADDLVGDAYQCFRGTDFRGQEGQFFTPPAAVRILVALVDPQPDEKVIDPACGAGGFLFAASRHLVQKGCRPAKIAASIFGVEKDEYLGRIGRMRMALLTGKNVNVATGDSLAWEGKDPRSFMRRIGPGSFDVVLTNPPFGTRIVAASEGVRQSFKLAHRWTMTEQGDFRPGSQLSAMTPPQVLFVERCLTLVRPGGRVGMVVPESILCGQSYRHVVAYLLREAEIEAVVGMPEALFKTSGRGGTHTKTALIVFRRVGRVSTRRSRKSSAIFMAESEWCGHDSRGRPIPKDNTDSVIRNHQLWAKEPTKFKLVSGPLGYAVEVAKMKDWTLTPRAYDPEIPKLLGALRRTHDLVQFGDLLERGTVEVSTGDEVGKLAYGTGEVPFVRTSDISNWEIKLDPKHGVSRDIFLAIEQEAGCSAWRHSHGEGRNVFDRDLCDGHEARC